MKGVVFLSSVVIFLFILISYHNVYSRPLDDLDPQKEVKEIENYSQEDLAAWNDFKVLHLKSYKDEEEDRRRMKNFFTNKRSIEKHNKLYESGVVSFKLKMNQFGDLSEGEMWRTGFQMRTPTTTRTRYNTEMDTTVRRTFKTNIYDGRYTTKTSTPLSTLFEPNKLALTPEDLAEWENFKTTYSKVYESEEEERKRMRTFLFNKHQIDAHNRRYERGEIHFRKHLNKFSDWATPPIVLKPQRTPIYMESTDSNAETITTNSKPPSFLKEIGNNQKHLNMVEGSFNGTKHIKMGIFIFHNYEVGDDINLSDDPYNLLNIKHGVQHWKFIQDFHSRIVTADYWVIIGIGVGLTLISLLVFLIIVHKKYNLPNYIRIKNEKMYPTIL